MPLPAADPVCLGVTLMVLWKYTSIYHTYTIIYTTKYNDIPWYIRRPRLRKGEREKEKEFVTQQG